MSGGSEGESSKTQRCLLSGALPLSHATFSGHRCLRTGRRVQQDMAGQPTSSLRREKRRCTPEQTPGTGSEKDSEGSI